MGWIRRAAREQAHPVGDQSPEVPGPSAEATHLGARIDRAVAAARVRRRPPGRPNYDLVAEHLDVTHYLVQSLSLLDRPDIDPVRHYLRRGAGLLLDPEINFSTRAYLERHPERREGDENPYVAWLRRGRAAGEIADPAVGIEHVAPILGMSVRDLADHLAELRLDLQHRLRHGRLGEMFVKAIAIDPTVADAWSETTRPKMTPVSAPLVARQMGAIHACHRDAGHRTARVVVVAGRTGDPGTAALVELLASQVPASEIAIVITDHPLEDTPDEFWPEVRRLDLATAASELTSDQAQVVLVELMRSLTATCVIGVDSELLHSALTAYGKALRATERIFLAFAPLEAGPFGIRAGAALRLYYRHAAVIEGFLCDSPLVDDLVEIYQLPEAEAARLHAVSPDTRDHVVQILLEESQS